MQNSYLANKVCGHHSIMVLSGGRTTILVLVLLVYASEIESRYIKTFNHFVNTRNWKSNHFYGNIASGNFYSILNNLNNLLPRVGELSLEKLFLQNSRSLTECLFSLAFFSFQNQK